MIRKSLFLLVFLLIPSMVLAGDYYLQDVKLFFPVTVKPLLKAGIKTTRALRHVTASQKGIKRLSRKTGLKPEVLKQLHEFCRFLVIPGIGPKVVKILQLSGVKTVEDLANSQASQLDQSIRQANSKNHVLGKYPSLDLLQYWIDQAKQLVKSKYRSKKSGHSGPLTGQHHLTR